jgi:hypothetical protein
MEMQIGDQGMEKIANALQQNKVTQSASFYFPFNHSFTTFIGTHHTRPQ